MTSAGVTLGDKEMYTGTLSNDKGVMIELAAVKDLAHWNYAPEAEYVYDFFKNYSRDLETGELIVHDPTILEQFADWCGDVADDISTRLGLRSQLSSPVSSFESNNPEKSSHIPRGASENAK